MDNLYYVGVIHVGHQSKHIRTYSLYFSCNFILKVVTLYPYSGISSTSLLHMSHKFHSIIIKLCSFF